jgi:hypothetical protein
MVCYFFQILLNHFVPMKGALFVQQLRALEILPVLRMGVQGPLYQDNSNNKRQLQGTIKLHRYKVHSLLCSKIYFFVLKHFMYITLYNCMKNEKSE